MHALSQAGSSIVGSEDIVEGDRSVVYTECVRIIFRDLARIGRNMVTCAIVGF